LIAGKYFDGTSSKGAAASFALGADGIARVHGLHHKIEAPIGEIEISDRVGNIARRLAFPGGGVFESTENDAIDEALAQSRIKLRAGWVHRLESRWRLVLGALVAVAFLSFAFVQWGVPALANQVARMLPTEVDQRIGMGTLETFDRIMFQPSRLPAEKRASLRHRFTDMTGSLDDAHVYRLEFRRSEAIGANAFALPSGIVVVTDELVDLSKADDEVIAVLAHEIGHVRGRHALRQMLQAAGVSALAVALLGDLSSISGILSAAPALLTAKQSRDFEREADTFAKQWLRDHHVAESNFDAILCRMSGEKGRSKDSVAFFASHPATAERAHCTDVN
jgi:Zn-dependent protease with chaperone function